ncbi:hypothetical protein Vadar_016404 [Vaccinium darrowii]|uniref:Uncharacterized protein n=1 Tax=Vaccinium darrowii TaxID=229202 RepID=A0ACB7YND0_9ERIC|nr:hypothetical protein Vadar_016404 [Vaccinium darrowii]
MSSNKRTPTVSHKGVYDRDRSIYLRPSSDRDPPIYLRTKYGRDRHGWFLLKTEPPASGITLSPVFLEEAPMFRLHSACTAVGSIIYSIGGGDPNDPNIHCPEGLSDVYWIDTLRPKEGWKKLRSSMNYPRTYTRGIAVDGNLYVMGSRKSSLKPEVYIKSDDNGGVDGGFWHVLRDSTGLKDTDSWSIYHTCIGNHPYTSAFVDGILYYLDHAHPEVMFGLDLSKPNNQPKKVVLGSNFDESQNCPWTDIICPTTYLFSLGSGKLAALWESDDNICDGPYRMHVYCTIIKMSREADCDGQVNFVACPLSCSNYYVQGSMVRDCLAVFPPETKQRTLENTFLRMGAELQPKNKQECRIAAARTKDNMNTVKASQRSTSF